MIKNTVARKFEAEAARIIGTRLYRVGGCEPVRDERQVVSKSVYPGSYVLLTVRSSMIYIVRRDRPDVVRCVRPEFFREQFGINLPHLLEKLIKEDKGARAQASIRELADPVSFDELIAMIEAQPDSAFA